MDKIKEIMEYMKNKYNTHTIILYGSYGDGTFTEESDVDIICFGDGLKEENDNSIIHGTQLDGWVFPSEKMEKIGELLHINGGIVLQDNMGVAEKLLEEIKREFINNNSKYSKEECEFHKNWLRKMVKRAVRGDVEGDFRYHWMLVDSLEIYFRIKGISYLGPKKSLNWLKKNDVRAFMLFEEGLKPYASREKVLELIEFIISTKEEV